MFSSKNLVPLHQLVIKRNYRDLFDSYSFIKLAIFVQSTKKKNVYTTFLKVQRKNSSGNSIQTRKSQCIKTIFL